MRAAVWAACMMLCVRSASADAIDQEVGEIAHDNPYKVRLAAVLTLSKSKDARAVLAVAEALDNDDEATIRRVSALALERMIDARTANDARELAFEALDKAVASDGDQKVRQTAERTLKALSAVRRSQHAAPAVRKSDLPEVFVNIEDGVDQSKRAPVDAPARMTKIVKRSVEKTGYATSWPGGLPTNADLATNKSRAFVVASTVKRIDIARAGGKTQISCTVAIRVAPWSGRDGGEKWEANRAASASGSAKAMTGNSDREVTSGVRDCLEAVAEDVASRQVVPFLRQLAGS